MLSCRNTIKELLEESRKYIAGLAASVAGLTAAKTALEEKYQVLDNENRTLSEKNKGLAEENIALKTELELSDSDGILSKYNTKKVLDFIKVFQDLNINVNEREIKQVLDNGITVNDILKFYNLFNREDKDVRDKLANTFIKEWILDGVTYDDLDKFLNLPYSEEFSDGGYAPMFLGSPRYAQGVNAKLLTKHFNIKDMIYLSESKKLNFQYIYIIMDFINKKQINLDDIKNMDKDNLGKCCKQLSDRYRRDYLYTLEEHLFRRCPNDINWNEILGEVEDMQKYNVDNPHDILLKRLEAEEKYFWEHFKEFDKYIV